ncbi:MAG: hypothetical protein EXS36_13640 [Pedosphaera sp.]|nr:hypothetical protein [Pedosphaera sp.]
MFTGREFGLTPPMTPSLSIVLWIYAALMLAGGLMGFLKAGSRASLIAGGTCAVIAALTAAYQLPNILAVLCPFVVAAMMGRRFLGSKKFMPAGLTALISIGVMAYSVIALRLFH